VLLLAQQHAIIFILNAGDALNLLTKNKQMKSFPKKDYESPQSIYASNVETAISAIEKEFSKYRAKSFLFIPEQLKKLVEEKPKDVIFKMRKTEKARLAKLANKIIESKCKLFGVSSKFVNTVMGNIVVEPDVVDSNLM
jgi:hypothetical protein